MNLDKSDIELKNCQYYEDIESIFANIEELRKCKNISQKELAYAVGISRSAYQKYLNGYNYSVKVITLYQIANYLDVVIEDLI